MPDNHLSSQFDAELKGASSRLMEMGGLVEVQIRHAIYALTHLHAETAQQVRVDEARVNAYEIEIDRDISSIIARRQPAAGDLRLLLAIARATANLERAGDEANKMARMVQSIIEKGSARLLPSGDLRLVSELASGQLRKSLDAFARFDAAEALTIIKDDDAIDREFGGYVRKLITYMMEDPRTISSCLDLLSLAKSIERIGDHAKNIAECTIYVVKGMDVRHASLDEVASAMK